MEQIKVIITDQDGMLLDQMVVIVGKGETVNSTSNLVREAIERYHEVLED